MYKHLYKAVHSSFSDKHTHHHSHEASDLPSASTNDTFHPSFAAELFQILDCAPPREASPMDLVESLPLVSTVFPPPPPLPPSTPAHHPAPKYPHAHPHELHHAGLGHMPPHHEQGDQLEGATYDTDCPFMRLLVHEELTGLIVNTAKQRKCVLTAARLVRGSSF